MWIRIRYRKGDTMPTITIDDCFGEFDSMEDVDNFYDGLAKLFQKYGTGDYFFVREVVEDTD